MDIKKEPFLTIATILSGIFAFAAIIIIARWLGVDLLARSDKNEYAKYPDYATLVVNGAPGFETINLVDYSKGHVYDKVTAPGALDGVTKWYIAKTQDRIINAYLYIEGSVNNNKPLSYVNGDGFYFKVSGAKEVGGYLVANDRMLPTPPSDNASRMLFDLKGVSYYTDHTKADRRENVNLLDYLNLYTQGYKTSLTAFIASQYPPTNMRRVSIFYRYADGASPDSGLADTTPATGY